MGSPLCTETSREHWRYIAEGGASIAFSYVGPANPRFTGMALRLRKVPLNLSSSSAADAVNEQQVDYDSLFHRTVIERLIPTDYLPRLEVVETNKSWLESLAQSCERDRPSERRRKDTIDVLQTRGVLATDLIGRDGWAVEIKPKWGFLPSPTYLSSVTSPIKTLTCRFCMHAHLKSTHGEHVAYSFCPLDLYSGVESRIRRALHALWDSWIVSSGSINNLRIFVEGNSVRPSTDPSSLSSLNHRLTPSSGESLNLAVDVADLRERFALAVLPVLLNSPVLKMLSTFQRTLDELDIEGLAALWEHAHAHLSSVPPLGAGIAEPTQAEWVHFVDEYLSRITSLAGEPQPSELRYYCLAYLLSATFKDCSIMVKMTPPDTGGSVARDGVWKGSVKVIDLDVKSISRLAKWEKLDHQIVAAYAGVEPRRCLDQGASAML